MSIDEWPECVRMERPGVVFELRNEAGQVLTTECVVPLFEMPFDWVSPPIEFRAVQGTAPKHSGPIPAPSDARRSAPEK